MLTLINICRISWQHWFAPAKSTLIDVYLQNLLSFAPEESAYKLILLLLIYTCTITSQHWCIGLEWADMVKFTCPPHLCSLEPQIQQSMQELGHLLSKVKGAGQVSLSQPSQRSNIQQESDMVLRPLMDLLEGRYWSHQEEKIIWKDWI